ncbi:translation initiation factor IF-2 [Candidatus Shapirobacteria bacterium]|nr:translation initiation factor IF-2 [Candidatus Shapirobacteria bacterium]
MVKKKKKIGLTSSGQSSVLARPPVVVILGHIDHGKTTLLSKIKEMDLTKKERGGITQHLGAYQINFKNQPITFIDTPGHAAFNNLRARGAKVADLAVLVVAANEGVKPQTVESLKFIQEAGIKFLVALNKIDLPEVSLEKAKKNLSDNGLAIEGYGGEIVVVPVSAKEGKGVNDLLEMILLLAEMEGLKGDPQGTLEAVVVESKIDSRRGPLATVLVRNGSLHQGESVLVEEVAGKVRAMFDDKGQSVAKALPGQPVEILGFSQVPPVGGQLKVIKDEAPRPLVKTEVIKAPKVEEDSEGKKVLIVLKADVEGSLEAIKGNLSQDCQIIKAEVGEVNESDILLAQTSRAEIIAFNVKVSSAMKKLAEREKVKISSYAVIYELLEELTQKILKKMEPTIDEEVLGEAEIIAEFKMKERVAGCRVNKGEMTKDASLHLLREGKVLGNMRFKSLKKGKNDVEKIKTGEEFGAVFSPSLDFNISDVIVSYRKPQS